MVTRYGYGRGEFFEGYDASRGKVLVFQVASAARRRTPGNATNPMVGSGMQQARNLAAEQAVEVVQNHEDGTGSASLAARRPKGDGNVIREWTLQRMSMEGIIGQSQERKTSLVLVRSTRSALKGTRR